MNIDILCRYGEEKTSAMLRYSEKQKWQPLSTELLAGRSDFQV